MILMGKDQKNDILAVGVVWLGSVEKTIAKKGSPSGLPFWLCKDEAGVYRSGDLKRKVKRNIKIAITLFNNPIITSC